MTQSEPTIVQLADLFQKNESIQNHLLEYIEGKKNDLRFGKYQIRKYLGKGSFARVFRAKNKQNDRVLALKVIDLQEIDLRYHNAEISEKARRYLTSEQENMKKCKSAYVLKMYQSFTNDKCKIFAMELCNSGTLEHHLKRKGRFTQANAIMVLKEIIFGLAEMHRNGIIHRDMKPANILIHNGIFKIADLGFSKELPLEEALGQHTVLGTRSTMAPEVVNQQAYSFKADIWSLGVIFFLMLFYDRQYTLSQNYRRAQKFIELKDSNKISQFDSESVSLEAVDFLRRTLEVDQEKRLDWESTLEHSVFIKKEDTLPDLFKITDFERFSYLRNSKQRETITKPELIKEQKQMKEGKDLDYMNEQQVEDFQILSRQYFQCRKAQFLLNKLIVPIEEKQLFDKKNQNQIELFHLLISRCKNNVDRALQMVKQHYDEEMFQFFSSQVNNLEQRIKLKYQFVTGLLNQLESKFGSIIKGKVNKIISKGSFNQRERFLTGEEGIDFSREEHTKFICGKYIASALKELKGEENDKTEVRQILKAFEMIVFLEEKQLKERTLQQYMKDLIKS